MKYILALLVLVVGCGCLAAAAPKQPAPPPELPQAVETMRASTVAIMFEISDGSMMVGCAGVWVSSSSFLTAAHCVSEEDAFVGDAFAFLTYDEVGKRGSRGSKDGPYHLAFLLARDEVRDLALLTTLAGPPHPFAFVAQEDCYTSQHVNMVGHTSGYPYTWAPAWISATRNTVGPEPIKGWFTQVATEGRGGNSGGGLWDDDGRLVGIASYADMHGWTWFVSRQTIAAFLHENNA